MPPNSSGSGWKVNFQQETTDLGSDGRAVPGVRVGFVTSHGVHGTVFVPRHLYSVEAVRTAVAAHVAVLDDVHGLSG